MFSLLRNQPQRILNYENDGKRRRCLGLMILTVLMTSCTGATSTLPVKGEILPNITDRAQTAVQPVPPLQRFTHGQVLYIQHCADCHGWEGRGDGPLSAVLTSKPPVLRQEIGIFAHNSDAQIVVRILSGTPF